MKGPCCLEALNNLFLGPVYHKLSSDDGEEFLLTLQVRISILEQGTFHGMRGGFPKLLDLGNFYPIVRSGEHRNASLSGASPFSEIHLGAIPLDDEFRSTQLFDFNLQNVSVL